ncbi:hypothetical protein Fot_24264 [Forsythia ovata]|uniref:Uncharacterized protein n=1 Tax=Forsythia ovata TaxID=205694 RepID=A0ABD1U5R3_9LAMI
MKLTERRKIIVPTLLMKSRKFNPLIGRDYAFDYEPKKNPTPALIPKMVQTKISLTVNSPPPAKGVVIKEPSPNSGRPTGDKVSGKGKEKTVEPPPKVKPTLKQAPSFSKTTQLGSSSGEKRWSSDSRSSPTKKLRTSVSSSPLLVELF